MVTEGGGHAPEEQGVGAVEQAPVAREQVARVLDAHAALDARLEEVAYHAGKPHDEAKDHAGGDAKLGHDEGAQKRPDGDGAHDAPHEPLDALVRRDARGELVSADRRAHEVGQGIVGPD
jgi:hypothetical protein